jgi:thioesterase domain-containing protein
MQITITGPRGGGATTLAVEIARMLEERGACVEFLTRHDCSKTFPAYVSLRRHAIGQAPSDTFNGLRVVIVDGAEPEDESSVKARVTQK